MNCGQDDSGTCCGLCDKKVVVVIATHERMEITTKNINMLKLQTPKPSIVIVCSRQDELEYYKTLGVNVALEPNEPLGRKWQCGVNIAKNINADFLVILGSDDLLLGNYIKEGLMIMSRGYDFVGTTHWFMQDNERYYHCQYTNRNVDYPIGSGKIYSKYILDKMHWKVFKTDVSRRLDDQGFELVKNNNGKIFLIREPKVLAVKGKWRKLNNANDYKTSPNISCILVNKDIIKI